VKVTLNKPGSYILAISGGVDSMVLLDLVSKSATSQQDLVVAHLNHGIRHDSYIDLRTVESAAQDLGLVFESKTISLGAAVSEDLARIVRYQFLREIKDKHQAQAIITAHHQDDLIETAIINIIRGTNRKGLSAINSHDDIIRPLLDYPKQDLIIYATNNDLIWREDSTNANQNYLRNYVRANITSRLNVRGRSQLIEIIEKVTTINSELDELVTAMLIAQTEHNHVDRQWFSSLPHNAAREVLAVWLRQNNIRGFDKKTLERLVVAAKVAGCGRSFPVLQGHSLEIGLNNLALNYLER
jgi:tRNA(Ile)-lysidine synthetase-like protein